jgi:hypothetical protein
MPNMVRNDRSLCAHNVRITCAKMSNAILICCVGWVPPYGFVSRRAMTKMNT